MSTFGQGEFENGSSAVLEGEENENKERTLHGSLKEGFTPEDRAVLNSMQEKWKDENKGRVEKEKAEKIEKLRAEIASRKKEVFQAPQVSDEPAIGIPNKISEGLIQAGEKMNLIKNTASFQDLMLVLKDGLDSYDGDNHFSYEDLKSRIEAFVNTGDEKFVTREYGLREKVRELASQSSEGSAKIGVLEKVSSLFGKFFR